MGRHERCLHDGHQGKGSEPHGIRRMTSGQPFGSPFRHPSNRRAEAHGWVVSSTKKLHKSIKKHGGHVLPPVVLVNLCQPDHAYKILDEDGNKQVSVFMPCTISVYQKDDGSTWIGTMNAGLLGRMFGGTVAEVMGGAVAADQQKFIAFAE